MPVDETLLVILLSVLATVVACSQREKLLGLLLVAAVVTWMLVQLCQSLMVMCINALLGTQIRSWLNQ